MPPRRRTLPTDIIPLAQAAHDAQMILIDRTKSDAQKIRALRLLYVDAGLNEMLDRILPDQRAG